MTLKEIALIVGLSVLVNFAINAIECALLWVFKKIDAWKYKRKRRMRK